MDRTRELLNRSAAGAIEAHDLRMRTTGRMTYLEFHLVVPGTMPVAEAHHDLRPGRGGAEGRNAGSDRDDPCGARGQGQA